LTGFPNTLVSNDIFAAGEFYHDGTGTNDSYGHNVPAWGGFNHFAPTISPDGRSASLTDDDAVIWYHNQGDLGELVQSISATFTPSNGVAFRADSLVKFSIDGMTAIIPEPSRASLLFFAIVPLALRRRRN